MTTLQATPRTEQGKGAARRLRADGQLPAVLYGPDNAPQAITVDPAKLKDIFKQTGNRNTVVDLQIDGQSHPVLVREVQRHPLSRELLHVDFVRLHEDRQVEVMVPVVPVGRPRGAQIGGRLRLIRRVIRVRCGYKDIPAELPVDVSHMWIGDVIKASEVPVPPGTTFLLESDFQVLTVYGKRGGAAAATDDASEKPAAEEGAAEEGEQA